MTGVQTCALPIFVVYQYDASAQSVEIRPHNNRNWEQFKVRDIIVGYVRAPKVRFEKDRYDIYSVSSVLMRLMPKDSVRSIL